MVEDEDEDEDDQEETEVGKRQGVKKVQAREGWRDILKGESERKREEEGG